MYQHIIIQGLLCFALLFGSSDLFAQNPDNPEIQAFRVGFYTKRLQLTPDEAKGFWPLHDAYSSELRAAQKASRQKLNEITQGVQALSDEQLSKKGDEFLVLKQKELDIVKKYHEEFKKVLPIRKVTLLYVVESNYKKKLLEEIRKRRQERVQNRRNNRN
ncbi:MAG: hypothetical protein R8P61_05410 [Bacteroidia bacterium]|nr:hypothetical protein [Bacteroidia bacterium]